MKFIEKYDMEHPNERTGYTIGCPHVYNYESYKESKLACARHNCKECWNREIPETKEEKKVEIKKVKRVAKVGEYVICTNTRNKFKEGEIVKCIEEHRDGVHKFSNYDKRHYLTCLEYLVLEGYEPHGNIVEAKGEEDATHDVVLTATPWPLSLKCEMLDAERQEMVDHPKHYNTGKREVIEEMRILFGDEAVMNFCKLNAYKYIRRADHKGKKEEDLKKAEWYMDYAAKLGCL